MRSRGWGQGVVKGGAGALCLVAMAALATLDFKKGFGEDVVGQLLKVVVDPLNVLAELDRLDDFVAVD